MQQTAEPILYLCRREIEDLCADIDSVTVMQELFRLHGRKETILPDEAYLGWTNSRGEFVRSLNMPGYVGGEWDSVGTKIINGNIANSFRGIPRASGLTLLFDPISGVPLCIMESAYISSLRTASVTMLAVHLLKGPEIHCTALIGAGVLALAHLQLFVQKLPHLQTVTIFDENPQRARNFQQEHAQMAQKHQVNLVIATSAEEAIKQAQLIVPVTTTTTGYIRWDWLQRGALVVNVSLDDVLPEVVMQADLIVVDDWELVKNDTRRLLGRMYREGTLLGPGETGSLVPAARQIDAQLGDLVVGAVSGRKTEGDIILVNPFGLAIEDIALARHVYSLAREKGIGIDLPR